MKKISTNNIRTIMNKPDGLLTAYVEGIGEVSLFKNHKTKKYNVESGVDFYDSQTRCYPNRELKEFSKINEAFDYFYTKLEIKL